MNCKPTEQDIRCNTFSQDKKGVVVGVRVSRQPMIVKICVKETFGKAVVTHIKLVVCVSYLFM